MKLITPETSTTILGRELAGGTQYLVSNSTAGVALMRTNECEVESHWPRDFSFDDLDHGAKIAVVREGGIGDLIFLTPWLHAAKQARPDVKIHVVTWPRYFCALAENPDVDAMIPYPLTRGQSDDYDQILWLEGFIERSSSHPVDTLARISGLEIADKRYRFPMTAAEFIGARTRFPRTARKRIGIQVYASTPARTYPPELLQSIVYFLAREHEVVLFAEPGTMDAEPEANVLDLSKCDPPLNFRQAAAIVPTCDAMLVPDSSLCHVAAAFNVPTIALFAAFDAETRVKYSPSVKALSVTGGCAPCFHHDNGFDRFPSGMPCVKSRRCDALAAIEPSRIVNELLALL